MTSQLHCFWCFFTAGSWENDTKNGAALTSLKTFIRNSNFKNVLQSTLFMKKNLKFGLVWADLYGLNLSSYWWLLLISLHLLNILLWKTSCLQVEIEFKRVLPIILQSPIFLQKCISWGSPQDFVIGTLTLCNIIKGKACRGFGGKSGFYFSSSAD